MPDAISDLGRMVHRGNIFWVIAALDGLQWPVFSAFCILAGENRIGNLNIYQFPGKSKLKGYILYKRKNTPP